MKPNRKLVTFCVFAALHLVSASSFGLTLGRARGAVLFGKELDLSVQVQFAAEDDVSATCFDADISYGDTPLERSRFTVNVQAGPQANTQLVRVHSSARVDDALVSLNLKTSCGPKASRHYVLLPEVVSELTSTDAAAQGRSATVAVPTKADGGGAPLVPPAGKAQATKPAGPRIAPRVEKPTAKPAAKPARAADDADARAANQVSSEALQELQNRVDEIAQWQARNGQGDAAKNEERVNALEAGIRDLQVITAKNQRNLQAVSEVLEANASPGYGRPLVYVLGGLLLACLAALAYVLRRLQLGGFDSAPWWKDGAQHPAAAVPEDEEDEEPRVGNVSGPSSFHAEFLASGKPPVQPLAAASQAAQPLPQLLDRDGGTSFDNALVADHRSIHSPLATVPQAMASVKAVRSDFGQSTPGALRAINTREMLDVRQQAEFFMALGQHDEAVRMLESNIQSSPDANPLVYLDLLKILHTLNRRSDFERYREEFNFQFTGRVPNYVDFLVEGNGLEAYEDICHQIVVLWPTEYTIDFIEQCLMRTAEDDPEQGMDLEAFKDLLLLYGVLKRLDQFYDSTLAPFSASRMEGSRFGSMVAELDSEGLLPTLSMPDGYVSGMELDLNLDLDISKPYEPEERPGNLIDFDMPDLTDLGKPKPDPA